MSGRDADLAILGGGLAGGLTALALAALRPDLRVVLVEKDVRCGGNHVWSFFDTDLADDARWLVEPLVVHHWDSHGVRFPGGERTLPMGYNSITSARLDAVLEQTLPAGMLLRGVAAVEVGAHHVTLADGRRIETGAVTDARGADSFPGLSGGWQKFVGQVVRTGPHGIDAPIIMDACVDQHDGFRFVYVLPFTPDTLFVEDTYYSDTPRLDRDGLAGRIADYLRGLGLTGQVVGEEQGVLPVVADGAAFPRAGHMAGVARIGSRAGLFHPLTSYSLPDAVRMALVIGHARSFTSGALEALCEAHAKAHWRGGAYLRLLARLMFGAGLPAHRWRIFERFYRQSDGLIARFYAGRMSSRDKLRLIIGRPPVPVGRAIATLLGRGAPLSRLDDVDPSPVPAVSIPTPHRGHAASGVTA